MTESADGMSIVGGVPLGGGGLLSYVGTSDFLPSSYYIVAGSHFSHVAHVQSNDIMIPTA